MDLIGTLSVATIKIV